MEKSGSVCFIRHPRTISDLMQPHLYKHEREYQIVKTIELGKIDYENFITDMLVDRQCSAVLAGRSLAMSPDPTARM